MKGRYWRRIQPTNDLPDELPKPDEGTNQPPGTVGERRSNPIERVDLSEFTRQLEEFESWVAEKRASL